MILICLSITLWGGSEYQACTLDNLVNRPARRMAGRSANISFWHFSGSNLVLATITSSLTANNSSRLAWNTISILWSPFSRKKTRALLDQATSFHDARKTVAVLIGGCRNVKPDFSWLEPPFAAPLLRDVRLNRLALYWCYPMEKHLKMCPPIF